jgi:lipoate-protein ligase B
LPLVDYETAWRRQVAAADEVRDGNSEVLFLLQHPPVFTFGRRVRPENLLIDADDLRRLGAGVIASDRGGDVTFHGPGQVVAYPILDLRGRGLGPNPYVRGLEECMIRTLRDFGLHGERVAGRPGVWAGDAKIGAIGVRIQGGVSRHGFALNVETDLSWFDAIVPCGLSDASVTSMQRLLGSSPGLPVVEDSLIDAFADVFDSAPLFEISEPLTSLEGALEPVPSLGR